MNEFSVMKSDKQKTLERNGCVFRGQELLDNHEIDISKECYCGRPVRTKIPGCVTRVRNAVTGDVKLIPNPS